jgi:hypothetical protein
VQTVRNYRTTSHGRFDTLAEAEAALAKAERDQVATIDVQRQAEKRANSNQRRMWNRMLRHCRGVHGWSSISDFINDVGQSPKPNYFVAPIDATKPVGPENFTWSEPQYDHSTRDGRNASSRSYRDNDPRKYRDRHLRREFGLDGIEAFDEKFAEQDGVCAICSQPETAMRRNKVLPLHVDHDHKNGLARGLLCTACNLGIGQLRDSPELLQRAIAYIEKWTAIHEAPLPDNVVKLRKD